MAWLTEHSDANKIVDGSTGYAYSYSYRSVDGDGYVTNNLRRMVTNAEYRYVGMTYAAAITCMSAMQAAGNTASLYRENDAGAYRVVAEIITFGAWSAWA
jgi:hypothetical protein